MHIILLSGGSGKRLWPLSNNVRSKQFIKLFKDENGKYESMVQRVYRQIKNINSNADVTIATSKSQVSAIRNQLGNRVSVCLEPCRRDTFPAIVLATSYLKDIKGLNDDDCVVVCPVDPYVDDSYYETVQKLESIVKKGESNLLLMGIEPTVPSEKYGYIIPNNKTEISSVSRFVEKPNKEAAKKYIESGALWNAGVFAFKLGYLLNKAHELINFTDYDDLFDKYDTLEKVSFDYAVVEKEPNIQVLRYVGQWKDVGTWNMMTEVMADEAKGEVILDDFCVDTNVVNELNIPIICMGCEDMVIAASEDGILVSTKDRSGYMKPYVEKLDNPSMFAEKSWGTFTVVDNQINSKTIKIEMKSNTEMSYHSHSARTEIWNIISGTGEVCINGVLKNVKAGDVVQIPVNTRHSIKAYDKMEIVEIQIGDLLESSDKLKYVR